MRDKFHYSFCSRPFSCCVWARGLWFRVFGYGPHIKLRAGHEPLVSERYGLRKAYYAGPFRFEWLKPPKGT